MPWQVGLWAHATIHAGAVGLVTGSLLLGLAEFAAHALIDDAKCMRRISTVTDQALHQVRSGRGAAGGFARRSGGPG